MRDVAQIKHILDEYNELSQVIEKMICQKHNIEDIDITCIYLQDSREFGHIFVGTFQKHNVFLPTNVKRFYIPLDEYFKFIDKEQNNE